MLPDDPRIKGLPEEIRKRYRGRSVPSPLPQIENKPKPVVEFMIAKTIISIRGNLTAGIKEELFIAASDWVVEAVLLKVSSANAEITLIATDDDNNETRKTIALTTKRPLVLIKGFSEVGFIFKAGETISIESSVDVNLIGSLELVQEGGKIIRTDNAVSEGSKA